MSVSVSVSVSVCVCVLMGVCNHCGLLCVKCLSVNVCIYSTCPLKTFFKLSC